MNRKYDKLYFGLIPGILLPVISFLVLWQVSAETSLIQYLKAFYKMESLAALISLSTIPNLLLFFLFIWTSRYRSARGVIIATLFMAGTMLIFKVI